MVRRYVRGPGEDEPFVIYEGPGTDAKSWLYADHQGSVTASADASGNPISAMSYGPFGEPSTTTGIELRYTGQMLDPDTGLYYYKARWYSPWMGRFLSPDPIGIDDGMHLYTYVGNDPVNYVDPLGLNKESSEYRCEESTTFALNTVGSGAQALGEGITLLGLGVATTGVGAVAGGYIAASGKIVGGVGSGIKLGAAYCEGHLLSSLAGEGVGALAGSSTKKFVERYNKGHLVNPLTGNQVKDALGNNVGNFLSGTYRNIKTEIISSGAGKAVGSTVEAIGKLFQ